MPTLNLDEMQQVVNTSAALRGKRRFQDAIDLLESKVGEFHSDYCLMAYIECFKAAQELGDAAKATEYAQKIVQIEPDFPSAKKFLARP